MITHLSKTLQHMKPARNFMNWNFLVLSTLLATHTVLQQRFPGKQSWKIHTKRRLKSFQSEPRGGNKMNLSC